MATIILAGGLSARMGRDKALLAFAGGTLLQTLVARFAASLGPVIVVQRPSQELAIKGAVVVSDVFQGAGPLGGLHAGLLASPDDLNFLLACDMPLASPELAAHLISLLDEHDAVVPILERGPEPLFAAYRKSCLPQVEESLRTGVYRMRDVLDRLDTLYVPETDLRRLDPGLQSFLNVNTPEDYDELVRP